MPPPTPKYPILTLLPLVGIGLFLVLYVVAAQVYPGGSQAYKMATGFSWLHNYWCNLLNEKAMNGQPNPAKPIALSAMLILCSSLVVFWYHLPTLFVVSESIKKAIRLSGILSTIFTLFIYTAHHDILLNAAAFFGLIALSGTFWMLYNARSIRLLRLGIACLMLVMLNNYIYYATDRFYLPILQKCTFVCVLCWISWLTIAMYNEHKLIQPTAVSTHIE